MPKVRIKLAFLGHLPHHIDTKKVSTWKSNLFEIVAPIDKYAIREDSDLPNWQFSDQCIERHLPDVFDGDVLIAVTRIPIEDNYYARRYPGNKVCLSYYEMLEILDSDNVPLENLILRVLYSVSFVYKRYHYRPIKIERSCVGNVSH